MMNETNISLIEKWFEYLQSLDSEKICSLYNKEHMKFEWPYAPSNFPKILEGDYQTMNTLVKSIFLGFKSIKVIRKNVIETKDENVLLVIWDGDAELVNGVSYKNSYVNIFKISNNEIYEIVEYYNPLVILDLTKK